jgi:hypothetical protein
VAMLVLMFDRIGGHMSTSGASEALLHSQWSDSGLKIVGSTYRRFVPGPQSRSAGKNALLDHFIGTAEQCDRESDA